MAYTIEQFSADCHRILAADPGPEGRKKVCEMVKKACADGDFVASITREATQFLARTRRFASLAVLCGGSEVDQHPGDSLRRLEVTQGSQHRGGKLCQSPR